jgi:hypothetical protein
VYMCMPIVFEARSAIVGVFLGTGHNITPSRVVMHSTVISVMR